MVSSKVLYLRSVYHNITILYQSLAESNELRNFSEMEMKVLVVIKIHFPSRLQPESMIHGIGYCSYSGGGDSIVVVGKSVSVQSMPDKGCLQVTRHRYFSLDNVLAF